MSAYKRVKLFLNSTQIKINIFFRGGKNKPGFKKGKKSTRKESYDLIVNIDMQEWNLTSEQVFSLF